MSNSAINVIPVTPDELLDSLRLLMDIGKSAMLWGKPGVAKTSTVRKLAEETGAHLIEIVLVNYDVGELQGVQYINQKKEKTVWYRPEFWPNYYNEDGTENENLYIVFLDEYGKAHQAQRNLALGIFMEHRVGDHKLPKNTFVVGAANPVESGVSGFEMEPHEKTRTYHFEVITKKNQWCDYAASAGVHPDVISFIRANGDKFLDTLEDQLANGMFLGANARVWGDLVSPVLYKEDEKVYSEEVIERTIRGAIGNEVFYEFQKFRKDLLGLPKGSTIFAADKAELQKIFSKKIGNLNQLAGFCQIVQDYVQPTGPSLTKFAEVLFDLADTDIRGLPTLEFAIGTYNSVLKHKFTYENLEDYSTLMGYYITTEIYMKWMTTHEKEVYQIKRGL